MSTQECGLRNGKSRSLSLSRQSEDFLMMKSSHPLTIPNEIRILVKSSSSTSSATAAAAADFKRRKSILDLVCVSWMWCVWSRKKSRKRKAKWNQKLANSSRHTMRGEISSIQKCELNFPSDSANRRKAPPETQSYEARLMGFVHLLDFRAFPPAHRSVCCWEMLNRASLCGWCWNVRSNTLKFSIKIKAQSDIEKEEKISRQTRKEFVYPSRLKWKRCWLDSAQI